MHSIIKTEDNRYYKKPSVERKIGAFVAGAAVVGIVPLTHFPIVDFCSKKMRKINKNVDTVEISKGLDKALEISKMKDAGVQIIEPSKRIKPLFKNRFIDKYNELSNPIIGASRGHNAACIYGDKVTILLKKATMGTAGFHEIGHAINCHSSNLLRRIPKLRYSLAILMNGIWLTALLKRKKVEGEKSKNMFDNVTTFVKDNAGKLTILASLPSLAEELKASQRGNKLAKQILSPELYKKVVKTNKISSMGYISGTLILGLTGFLVSKVNDIIAPVKEVNKV